MTNTFNMLPRRHFSLLPGTN